MGHSRGARTSQRGTKGDELTGAAATSNANSSGRAKNKRRRRAAIDVKERRQGERKFSAMTKRQQRKMEKKAQGDGRRTPQPSF
jgi:hypothetical protein